MNGVCSLCSARTVGYVRCHCGWRRSLCEFHATKCRDDSEDKLFIFYLLECHQAFTGCKPTHTWEPAPELPEPKKPILLGYDP